MGHLRQFEHEMWAVQELKVAREANFRMATVVYTPSAKQFALARRCPPERLAAIDEHGSSVIMMTNVDTNPQSIATANLLTVTAALIQMWHTLAEHSWYNTAVQVTPHGVVSSYAGLQRLSCDEELTSAAAKSLMRALAQAQLNPTATDDTVVEHSPAPARGAVQRIRDLII
ncbi:MAG: hypothetical protein ACPGR8_10340 [Limisphaerales bacterium]